MYLESFSSLELYFSNLILNPFWDVRDGIGYSNLDANHEVLKEHKEKKDEY